jgi:tRNA 2-selenouridine synthase
MSWRELDVEQFNRLKDPLVLDVRSPCEHEAERIPKAINIPLLTNDERAEVGTLYKNGGEAAARILALKMIAPKIPSMIDQILNLKRQGQTVVVHCWRGGLRSETVASLLSVVGLDCLRLTGGYKSWRKKVLQDFAEKQYEFEVVVLHGLTGSGKTAILHGLEAAGQAVLDLEALANHRGSVFGGIGLGDQPSQKNFDAAIWTRLSEFKQQRVYVEAESRKIGKLAVPDCILQAMASGRKILVTSSLACRAKRILAEYASPEPSKAPDAPAISLFQCHHLKERLGTKRVLELEEQVRSGNTMQAVTILLSEYYDPLYMKQIERQHPFDLEICSEDISDAVTAINRW